jgi:Flp pilus assembly protein TadG
MSLNNRITGWQRIAALARRLCRSERAIAATEFALLAPIFMLFVCMLLELGMVLFTQSVLDNAAREGARGLRTNQVNSSSDFITAVCGAVGTAIPSCSTKLQYNIQAGSAFSGFTVKTGALGTTFVTGNSGQDMLVQIGYSRTSIIPWASVYLGGTQQITSTVAFQNEPY